MTSATTNCQHCGLVHQQTCPRIKAIEYHDNGTVRRVEFHSGAYALGDLMEAFKPQHRRPETTWGAPVNTCGTVASAG